MVSGTRTRGPWSHQASSDGVFGLSFRVAPWAAWLFPSLELRAANSYTCLILDLDGGGSYERAERAVRRTKVGALNWAVENKRTGGMHGVWTLAKPVHRADMALAAPLKKYGRISEYYAVGPGRGCGLYRRPDAQSHGGRSAPGLRDALAAPGAVHTRRIGGVRSLRLATSKSLQNGGGSQLRRVRELHALGRISGRISALRSWVRPIVSMTASSTLWTRRKSPGSRDRWSATAASGSSAANSDRGGIGSEASWGLPAGNQKRLGPPQADAGPRPGHHPGLAMRSLHTLSLAAPRALQTGDQEDSPARRPALAEGGGTELNRLVLSAVLILSWKRRIVIRF